MYEYGGMRQDTKEKYSEDKNMVVALDFVTDLLIVIDVLSTLVLLMIRAQELQQPGWKIIPNTEKLFELSDKMLKDLQDIDNPETPWNLDVKRWPHTSPLLDDIFSKKKFKTNPLVDDWLLNKSVPTNIETPC